METVRLAGEADLPVVAGLLGQALGSGRAMRGGIVLVGSTSADDVLDHWTALGAAGGPKGEAGDAAAAIFLGEFHQAVVGLGAARTFRRGEAAEPLSGGIECCYVEEEARGVGVGTALMEAMVAVVRGPGMRGPRRPGPPR